MIKRISLSLVGALAVCAGASAQPPPPGSMSPGGALRAEGDIPGAIAAARDPTVAPLIDPDLVTARDDKRRAAFEEGLVARINARPDPPIKDVAFARALWKLAAWDQAFFQEVGIAARKTGMKSSVVEAIWKLKRSQGERPAKPGSCRWIRYANMYDRSLFNEDLPQRYGTHTRYNELTKSEELYPLEDESRVDEWRKEVGLPPLQEALAPLRIVFEPRKK